MGHKRQTNGKCMICKLFYRWIAPPLLREACCPKCNHRLERSAFVCRDGLYGPPAGYQLAHEPPTHKLPPIKPYPVGRE